MAGRREGGPRRGGKAEMGRVGRSRCSFFKMADMMIQMMDERQMLEVNATCPCHNYVRLNPGGSEADVRLLKRRTLSSMKPHAFVTGLIADKVASSKSWSNLWKIMSVKF